MLAGDRRLTLAVEPTTAFVGGGSLPQQGLPSFAVTLRAVNVSTQALADRLRAGAPSVVGRKHDDRVFLDMRTVRDADLASLREGVRLALVE